MRVWRFAYIGGADTPGPDPKAVAPTVGSTVAFNIGKSGGVSYKWDFGDGTERHRRDVSHTYETAGDKTATLTVTYADGQTSTAAPSRRLPCRRRCSPTSTHDVGATVPTVLSLTLGTPASFGSFTPSVAQDYTASTTATVLATSGDALLSVFDPATTATGPPGQRRLLAAERAAGQGHQLGRDIRRRLRGRRRLGQPDLAADLHRGGER